MDDRFKKHGDPSWCELITTDIPAAKAFYTKLFGWTAEDQVIQGEPYTIVKMGKKDVGGITVIPKEAGDIPPQWGIYITVDDVDKTAKEAERLGGKVIIAPTDIPKHGRFCTIEDPQGGFISIIKYI